MTTHFNESSKTWDSPEKIQQARTLAAAIRQELRQPEPQKVLEIGCGTGLLGAHFIGPAAEYTGVDASEGMLERLREKFPANPRVKTELLDLDHELPSSAGFTLVLSSMAFHHLARPGELLLRLFPLLAPGCELALVDLDQEDGSFHKDPAAAGVKHFGFSRETIQGWQDSGLKLEHYQIVDRIEKNGKSFGRFLAVFRKP